MNNEPTISIVQEIPEHLEASVQQFLKTHPKWSRERVDRAALSLFLMQNGSPDMKVNGTYLDALFGQRA